MMTPSLEQRLNDLTDHLDRDWELLKEYEDALRYEDEPRRKARYRQAIEQLRESYRRYQVEYEQLNQQVSAGAARVRSVAQQLQQMDQKLDLVLRSQSTIYQDLHEMQQMVLAHYTSLVEALDNHKLPDSDIQEMWAIVEHQLPTLPTSQTQEMAEIIKNPALDTKHKLKVTLPIVPLLMNYEGEFELGSGFDLKAIWKTLKARLRKQPAAQSQKSIWQLAQEIRQNLTEEDLRQLPRSVALHPVDSPTDVSTSMSSVL